MLNECIFVITIIFNSNRNKIPQWILDLFVSNKIRKGMQKVNKKKP